MPKIPVLLQGDVVGLTDVGSEDSEVLVNGVVSNVTDSRIEVAFRWNFHIEKLKVFQKCSNFKIVKTYDNVSQDKLIRYSVL